jgi:hypothetical protein
MSRKAKTGNELALESVEKTVPYESWLIWLKNLALECITHLHLAKKTGYKHDAVLFWNVIILSALMALSFDEAANILNDILWKEYHSHQRRKTAPKRYGGWGVRLERLCPNGDQVRKYRNSLPQYVITDLNHFIFDIQIAYAKKYQLLSKHLTLLVDNTQEWYYGKERYPQNEFINSGYGPGTSRKRNYLGNNA